MGNEDGNVGMGLSQGLCPECGYSHPPVSGGCPMKKVQSPSGEILDFNIFLNPMKDILLSQVKMKNIKESSKFFKWMVVECTKIAEEYKE